MLNLVVKSKLNKISFSICCSCNDIRLFICSFKTTIYFYINEFYVFFGKYSIVGWCVNSFFCLYNLLC